MTTLQSLATDLTATPDDIADYLGTIGVPDLNGWKPEWIIHPSEERAVRAHWGEKNHG